MLDSAYLEAIKEKLLLQLSKEKVEMSKYDLPGAKTMTEKVEQNKRIVHYGNVRYIEGQLNILNSLISLKLGA